MRITLLVDALSPQLSGIGRYTWELCHRLPLHPEIDHTEYFRSGYWIADPAQLLDEYSVGRKPGKTHRFPGPKTVRDWLNGRKMKSSLVHAPNYFLPEEATQGIITVHDLSVFKYPETHPVERVRQFERLFSSSVTRAGHVVTDSETVRQELIDQFGVADKKVSAVPLGVDPSFRPRPTVELTRILTEMGLKPGCYGLCVSTFEPRKKIAQLIEAWSQLPRRLLSTYPLVLAGSRGWLNEELHDLIKSSQAEGWLRHLGFVPEATLPYLYGGAAVFAYPSTYEGFGLPPVEAMASGVPTVIANRSCLPEVCGEAAKFIDPDDIGDFTSTLEQSLTDIEWRESAISQGLEQAGRYSWERCIDETISVYKKIWCGGVGIG